MSHFTPLITSPNVAGRPKPNGGCQISTRKGRHCRSAEPLEQALSRFLGMFERIGVGVPLVPRARGCQHGLLPRVNRSAGPFSCVYRQTSALVSLLRTGAPLQ
jgi:hypothetical protein